MASAIEEYDANRLLNSDEEGLINYFVERTKVEPLKLLEPNIEVTQAETKIDVSRNFDYSAFGRGEGHFVPGTRIQFHIPYEGEGDLFRLRPSTHAWNPPEGWGEGNELILQFEAPSGHATNAKTNLEQQLSLVRQYVGWVNADVEQHNRSLEATARSAVQARRQRLLQDQNLAASLGYPLRERSNAPRTYALPSVRRKITPPPPSSSAPFLPEPVLDEANYEHILKVMTNMVMVMEHSPDAFAHMNEEDLRTHFLVQLNGQYEGRASAETFRGNGKTDIMIVEQDRSVFIAECKFWDGPASLKKALDQLLDYATWRDAKTAVLVFNRKGDFTRTLEAVPAALASHTQHIGDVIKLGDSTFRSKLRQRDDSGRVLVVTTMIFNVPTERARSERIRPRRR